MVVVAHSTLLGCTTHVTRLTAVSLDIYTHIHIYILTICKPFAIAVPRFAIAPVGARTLMATAMAAAVDDSNDNVSM